MGNFKDWGDIDDLTDEELLREYCVVVREVEARSLEIPIVDKY